MKSPTNVQDLKSETDKLVAEIKDSYVFNASTCSNYLNKITGKFFNSPSRHFMPVKSNIEEINYLKVHGVDILYKFWVVKTQIRSNLRKWHQKGDLDQGECLTAMKRSFRQIRIAEDFLGDWLYENKIISTNKVALKGVSPALQVNANATDFKLRSGDVLLVREVDESGRSHTRIVFYYKDLETGKAYLVKSMTENGSSVELWKKYKTKKLARVVLFRLDKYKNEKKNRQQAQNQAKAFYEKPKTTNKVIFQDIEIEPNYKMVQEWRNYRYLGRGKEG